MRFSGTVRAIALALTIAVVPATAQAESLRQALASAYLNNPDIMSALLSVKATAEGIAVAKAGQRPTIGLSGNISGRFAAEQGKDFSTGYGYQLGASYNQTLFDNFQTDAAIEQARALTEVSKYSLRNSEQNVLLSVVQAYYAVIRDTQLVQMRAENMRFFDAQVNSADDRLRLGEGTRIDVSQAKARQAQAVASYRAAVASLQTSQASFQRWVGHKPSNLTSDFNFGRLLPSSIDAAIELAETSHPALLSARAAIRAAQAGSDQASAAFGPTLNLIGSLCGVGCFTNLAGEPKGGMSGSVSLQLSIPIYAGGALGANIRKANLNQIKSEVDALSARDQIRESVISAWSSLQNASAQITSAQSAVESGRLVVEGTVSERDVGQKTTLDVLNAQAELTTAQEGLISARASKMIAAFSLLAASGRLSAEDLQLDVTVHSADGYIASVEDVWAELRAIND
ncbi:TolC family outer membrane protein [Devosia sp.]|uniref:TolC family outer membrane protein n=1 Tax=Devosia sp. TaxID=1871048 RepID=UPI003A8E7B66